MSEIMSARYPCSPLDEIIPPLYYAYILTFKTVDEGSRDLFRTLEIGYKRLLTSYPILLAELSRDDSSTDRCGHIDLVVPTNPTTPELIRVDLTTPDSGWKYTYAELEAVGMPSSKLDATIIAPLAAGVETSRKVFSAQFNAISGGVLLAVCFSHTFVDALGASTIIGLWAESCCDPHSADLTADRLLCSKDGINLVTTEVLHHKAPEYTTLKGDTELWKLLGLDWKEKSQPGTEQIVPELPLVIPAVLPQSVEKGTTSRMFSFSPDMLKILKRKASPKPSNSEKSWISSNDALIAFLWVHIMRARFPAGVDTNTDLESIVTVAINGRKELSLPESYIGNVIFCNMCSKSLQMIIAPETELPYLAQSIRHTVQKNNTRDGLGAALSLAASIPSDIIRRLRYGFTDFNGPDLITTSWVDLPLYKMDWGNWDRKNGHGHIDFFRLPAEQFQGLCCIFPRRNDGTVEITLGMKTEDMERLLMDEEFLHFATAAAM